MINCSQAVAPLHTSRARWSTMVQNFSERWAVGHTRYLVHSDQRVCTRYPLLVEALADLQASC